MNQRTILVQIISSSRAQLSSVLTIVLAPRIFERRLLRKFLTRHLSVNLRDLRFKGSDRLLTRVDVGWVSFQKRIPDRRHVGLHAIGRERLPLLYLAAKIHEKLLLGVNHMAIAHGAVPRRHDGRA